MQYDEYRKRVDELNKRRPIPFGGGSGPISDQQKERDAMNEITISIDALRQLIEGQRAQPMMVEEVPTDHGHVLGRDCIIRGDRSGVFFGNVARIDPATNTVELESARHIWSWQGAANTAELAAHGVGKPNECKFVAAPDRIQIWDVIEVIPCSAKAAESLLNVPLWSER